jgi:hypothetical protein
MDRNELKRQIFESQNWRCWVKGCPYPAIHLHESIVTKGDVQASPAKLKTAINHPFNCVGLCYKHHGTKLEPDALEVFEWMCDQHGREPVVSYFESLAAQFKVLPGRLKEVLK